MWVFFITLRLLIWKRSHEASKIWWILFVNDRILLLHSHFKQGPYSLCVTVWNRTLKLWFNHLFECEDISSEFWIYVYVGKAVCNFTSYLKIRIFFLQHLVHVLCKFTSTYSGAMLIIILHFYDIVWYCVTMLWYFFLCCDMIYL